MRISDWSSDVCSSDLYGAGDVSRLRFIRRAQAIGFSLDEIAGLLNLGGESSCEQMQRLVERKLADVRLRLGELRQLECDLEQLRVQCSHVPAGERCPTLDLLEHARSEEHTSELQSLMRISYAVFCLQKKKMTN